MITYNIFSSIRRHTTWPRDWSSDVCSSDLQEKERIKLDVTSTTFFESAKFLRGENGVAKVILEREDASLGRVELKVVSAREVAGGRSEERRVGKESRCSSSKCL